MTEQNSIQKQIDDLARSDRNTIKLGIAIILILLGVIIYLFWKSNNPQSTTDTRIQAMQDSLRVHDIQRDQAIQLLNSKISHDSLQYAGLRADISQTNTKIATINQQYANQRNHITNSTPDEQFSSFSEWLSHIPQEDSH